MRSALPSQAGLFFMLLNGPLEISMLLVRGHCAKQEAPQIHAHRPWPCFALQANLGLSEY